MTGLTPKQMRFVNEYLIDLNATRAYLAVYTSVMSESAAAVNASKLLRNTKVAAYIAERFVDRQERTEITQDSVVRELALIAFANACDYAQIQGGFVHITETKDLTKDQQRAIAGIKETQNGTEVKLHDKVKALELLGRHLGLFVDRHEIKTIESEWFK